MLRRLDNLLARKEWVQLRREAEGILRLPDLDDHTLGRVYRAIGRASIGLCQFDSSVQYFEVGLPYALRAGDWDTVGCIQIDLGGVYMVLRNRSEARRHLEEYLMHLPRYTEAGRFEGRAHYNLGLLYRQEKQYPLAVAAYKQALRCFLDRQAIRDVADTHQNIAWLLLVLGKAEEARTHINYGSSYHDAPEDFATEQLILQGFLHCVLGDVSTAMGYLTPVLEERVTVSEGNKASARWVAAQVLLQQKQLDPARRWVQEALAIALAAKETHLVGLCVDLETKIRSELAEEATNRASD
ncbi:MAG: tetratricopeptide repeat protein [Bacillota bacterium]